jgi:hypothetical protein
MIQAAQVIPAVLSVEGNCNPDTLNVTPITQSFPVSVDLTAPQCVATIPSTSISDAQVGDVYTMSIVFTEAMDVTSLPTGSPITDATFNSTFQFVDAIWTNDTMLEYHFQILDNNEDIILTIDNLLMGSDLAGNALTGCLINQVYEIDTQNHGIDNLLLSSDSLDDTNCADGLVITVVYDEEMSPTPEPIITLSAGSPPLEASGIGSWNNDYTQYSQSFNCVGITQTITDIDVTIAGHPTDAAGNSSMDTTYADAIDLISPAGLGVQQSSDLLIYPNPSSGNPWLTIQSIGSAMRRIMVNDALGRTLIDDIQTSHFTKLHTANWSNGIYLLRIETEEGVHITPFILSQAD